MNHPQPQATRQKITDIFSRDEIKQLTARSDLMGFWAVISTWMIIAATFACVAWASTHLTTAGLVAVMLLALIILAGRQLCLAIMMHDAAHSTLFKSKWLNDVFTDWVCAKPIWNDLHQYRPYHLTHHAKTSSPEDPDLSLVAGLPTTKLSLTRKLARDTFGLTGLKFLLGRLLMDLGFLKWSVTNNIESLPQQGRIWWDYPLTFIKNSFGMIITNSLLFIILAATGYGWLYGLWVLAYITPFPLFIRIRNMAEHACTEKTPNMFKNTRTTRAGWLARATVAPLRVNYHIEHHLMASVPYFRLPLMHEMLRARDAVQPPPSYLNVLALVSTPKGQQQ
jgi:fatty acid desaturase